jgi:hypothetical protein
VPGLRAAVRRALVRRAAVRRALAPAARDRAAGREAVPGWVAPDRGLRECPVVAEVARRKRQAGNRVSRMPWARTVALPGPQGVRRVGRAGRVDGLVARQIGTGTKATAVTARSVEMTWAGRVAVSTAVAGRVAAGRAVAGSSAAGAMTVEATASGGMTRLGVRRAARKVLVVGESRGLIRRTQGRRVEVTRPVDGRAAVRLPGGRLAEPGGRRAERRLHRAGLDGPRIEADRHRIGTQDRKIARGGRQTQLAGRGMRRLAVRRAAGRGRATRMNDRRTVA